MCPSPSSIQLNQSTPQMKKDWQLLSGTGSCGTPMPPGGDLCTGFTVRISLI